MNFIKYLIEGIAFVIIVVFFFNLITQFLQTLNMFEINQVNLIGMISVLLATDNLLTKSFFGYKILT